MKFFGVSQCGVVMVFNHGDGVVNSNYNKIKVKGDNDDGNHGHVVVGCCVESKGEGGRDGDQ